jgi:hypothetical protein
VVDLLQSIRWQFDEDPGLNLSPADAAQIWQMDQARMSILFETFVEVGFLERTDDGRYHRRPDLDDLPPRYHATDVAGRRPGQSRQPASRAPRNPTSPQ